MSNQYLVVFLISTVGLCTTPLTAQTEQGETVRDRLWIWGHPAGVYNDSYLKKLGRNSTIEPVAAADYMGIRNLIFIRYGGKPQPPFEQYYQPFKKLDRVYWSLVGASGATSAEERRHVYQLAEGHENVAGFILDDFFHEGGVAHHGIWLAENNAAFPVTVTLTAPQVSRCDTIDLVQSDWRSGDYRSRDFIIELSSNGKEFKQVARGTLPNVAAGKTRVRIPQQDFLAFRIRILNTHDTEGAISCGLQSVELFASGRKLNLADWTAENSSNYAGYPATHLVGGTVPFRASLTPQQLHDLSTRKVRGKQLPVMAVVYSTQISPRAKQHLDQVDQVCLWTWHPKDLKQLAANLSALERLVGDKPILLGCYMYDFSIGQPLSIEHMQTQTELGYRWLQQGRVDGIIFLATPNVDVGLEAVEWTRKWIAQVGDQALMGNR